LVWFSRVGTDRRYTALVFVETTQMQAAGSDGMILQWLELVQHSVAQHPWQYLAAVVVITVVFAVGGLLSYCSWHPQDWTKVCTTTAAPTHRSGGDATPTVGLQSRGPLTHFSARGRGLARDNAIYYARFGLDRFWPGVLAHFGHGILIYLGNPVIVFCTLVAAFQILLYSDWRTAKPLTFWALVEAGRYAYSQSQQLARHIELNDRTVTRLVLPPGSGDSTLGRPQSIPRRSLRRGQLVVMAPGDEVPADVLLLWTTTSDSGQLLVDERQKTGESIVAVKWCVVPPEQRRHLDRCSLVVNHGTHSGHLIWSASASSVPRSRPLDPETNDTGVKKEATQQRFDGATHVAFAGTRLVEGGACGLVIETGSDCAVHPPQQARRKPPTSIETRMLRACLGNLYAMLLVVACAGLVIYHDADLLPGESYWQVAIKLVLLLNTMVPLSLPQFVAFASWMLSTRIAQAHGVVIHRDGTLAFQCRPRSIVTDKTGTLTTNRTELAAIVVQSAMTTPAAVPSVLLRPPLLSGDQTDSTTATLATGVLACSGLVVASSGQVVKNDELDWELYRDLAARGVRLTDNSAGGDGGAGRIEWTTSTPGSSVSSSNHHRLCRVYSRPFDHRTGVKYSCTRVANKDPHDQGGEPIRTSRSLPRDQPGQWVGQKISVPHPAHDDRGRLDRPGSRDDDLDSKDEQLVLHVQGTPEAIAQYACPDLRSQWGKMLEAAAQVPTPPGAYKRMIAYGARVVSAPEVDTLWHPLGSRLPDTDPLLHGLSQLRLYVFHDYLVPGLADAVCRLMGGGGSDIDHDHYHHHHSSAPTPTEGARHSLPRWPTRPGGAGQVPRDLTMLTGDKWESALAVGAAAGWLSCPDAAVHHVEEPQTLVATVLRLEASARTGHPTLLLINGRVLDAMVHGHAPELSRALDSCRARIVYRASPQAKQVLVRFLQRRGDEVIMIGDGANDVAAIKAANVGIAIRSSSSSPASNPRRGRRLAHHPAVGRWLRDFLARCLHYGVARMTRWWPASVVNDRQPPARDTTITTGGRAEPTSESSGQAEAVADITMDDWTQLPSLLDDCLDKQLVVQNVARWVLMKHLCTALSLLAMLLLSNFERVRDPASPWLMVCFNATLFVAMAVHCASDDFGTLSGLGARSRSLRVSFAQLMVKGVGLGLLDGAVVFGLHPSVNAAIHVLVAVQALQLVWQLARLRGRPWMAAETGLMAALVVGWSGWLVAQAPRGPQGVALVAVLGLTTWLVFGSSDVSPSSRASGPSVSVAASAASRQGGGAS